MQDPAYIVECARIQDITAMLNLEKKYFDPCWHSEAAIVRMLIRQEPMMFRVCKVKGKVKGYYWVFPLKHAIWEKVISGEMPEGDLVGHIKSFQDKDLYLYIASVIVEQSDKHRKSYTKALVHDFGRHFVLGRNSDVPDIRATGAFTISEGGRRLMERANFSYRGKFRAHGQEMQSWAIDQQKLVQARLSNQELHRSRKIA